MKEVVDKQKEQRNANKQPVYSGKTGLTAAGIAERDRQQERERRAREEAEREREREKQKEAEEDKDRMDVDEPADIKGKGRK